MLNIITITLWQRCEKYLRTSVKQEGLALNCCRCGMWNKCVKVMTNCWF